MAVLLLVLPIVVVVGDAAVRTAEPADRVPAPIAAMVGPAAGQLPELLAMADRLVASLAAVATTVLPSAAAAVRAAAAGACGAVSCGWPAAASAAPARPPAAAWWWPLGCSRCGLARGASSLSGQSVSKLQRSIPSCLGWGGWFVGGGCVWVGGFGWIGNWEVRDMFDGR